MSNIEAMEIWQKYHWIFSVYIQNLIICLKRFQIQIESENLNDARIELETASELMIASAAAMKEAGSFARQMYEDEIRPMMAPPNVKSEKFSGLMHWDHAYFITVLKQLKPIYKTLPASLEPQHKKFVLAYKILSDSHKGICSKFGGNEVESLREVNHASLNNHTAIDMLNKFEQNRLRLIDPITHSSGKCPFGEKNPSD